MNKDANSSGDNWGGSRPNAGRPKKAIVTAVRFNITCPYCKTGFKTDVLAVHGQMVVCSQCGRSSVVPSKSAVRKSNEQYDDIELGVLKQGALWEE